MVAHGVEARVKLAFPDQMLKLILVLREPIARAYSAYEMATRLRRTQVGTFYVRVD